jgi:DHA1 family tetracycline resistance protein-like MFS transporter
MFFKKFLPLFMVLFIDSMGMGILFPILAIAFMNPSVHFLAPNTNHAMRTFDYGLVISTFMLCWFFGAAIFGEYSDIKGRKKSLLICLFGAAFGYVLSAFAISFHSISLLIIGRVIAGLTAGSQSIAQAAIVDGSNESNLNKNMGYMTLVMCLGFVAGPLIGGLFSDSALFHLFDLATPMYIAAILSITNVILLKAFFTETHISRPGASLKLQTAIILFIDAFKDKNIRGLCVIFLIFIFGWSNYYSFISLYLVHSFHYTAMMSSLFAAFLGLGFCLGSGYLNAKLGALIKPKISAIIAMIIAAIGCALTIISHNQFLLWIYALIIGTSVAIAYPNILTLFALQVDAEKQGWVMGVSGSMMALSFGLTTLGSGFASMYIFIMPLILAVVGFVVSTIILTLVGLNKVADS